MENKKVAILMSTYNGEKYLKEQIDSLVNQTYKNLCIIIRDDGSNDNTINIIKEYQKNNANIIFKADKNIGFMNSFFELLKECNDAEYYAYCDQDDIWMEDKIERAVAFLDKADKDKPVLYFSNSDYYDEHMNYITSAPKVKMYNFRNALVECVTQGMTMVINNTTRKMMIDNKPTKCLFHDWWTYMLCSGLGEIIYDEKSLVKYRRHNKSVTSEGKSKIDLLLYRINEFIIGNSLKKIKDQIIQYDEFYYDKLNDENKKTIRLFTNRKNTIINTLKKVFYYKRFRKKLTDEIALRLLFLFGVL